MNNNVNYKNCKKCGAQIPFKAKKCQFCGKSQQADTVLIALGVIGAVILFFGIIASFGSNSDEPQITDNNESQKQQEIITVASDGRVSVGQTVKTKDLSISYLSAKEWVSDNRFIQPKEGYVFYEMEFEFENIGKSDQYISGGDFKCYADGYSMDKSYYGDNYLSTTTISSGKKIKGTIMFQIPSNAQDVTLEYETNVWTENKIIFIVK